MLGRARGAVVLGVDARPVEVEVDLGGGLPTICTVGLPDTAVREGIERMKAALPRAGFRLPRRRVIINLAPASLRKQGAALDLAMACALLRADGQVGSLGDPRRTMMAGELGLDGSVRPVRGALAIALAARAAGCRRLLIAAANADEAALVGELEVVPLAGLPDLAALAAGEGPAVHRIDAGGRLARAAGRTGGPDLADVRGQAGARRAVEIAAAGAHHLLLSGPPGSGKTMLARRLPGILPPLQLAEALEVTRVAGVAGSTRGLVSTRPFRAPHAGVTAAGFAGGGTTLQPGEMTLASHGVLYLDEFPEFRREVLESLRQPLEDGVIEVVRARQRARFPARFQLVASMNPCPCGYAGGDHGRCGCTPLEVRRYRARLSGPLLDRFDLVVSVPAVDWSELEKKAPGESSAEVRERVIAARARQQRRQGTTANARLAPGELRRVAPLDPESAHLVRRAHERLGLSARAVDRLRRVARTLADLQGEPTIAPAHVAEALRYR